MQVSPAGIEAQVSDGGRRDFAYMRTGYMCYVVLCRELESGNVKSIDQYKLVSSICSPGMDIGVIFCVGNIRV